ncbi:hypothetical protein RIVM261_078620 [Rivularia sp. IAM M-261]|nr:hypothetical protein RIVM261_078620 [Rivularia sp. IAM M-261]
MASGYIYILSNPAFKDNLYKIGHTTKNVPARANQLYTTGVPAKFEYVYVEDVENSVELEKVIHKKLANFRYNKRREFFEIPIQQAISTVQEVTQRLVYEKGTYILNKNTAFRWFFHHEDFIILVRYKTFTRELNINPIIDFWICNEGDQITITNIPEEDALCLDDELITLDLINYQPDDETSPINGILHEVCDIHPGDRIIWLVKSKEKTDFDDGYYVHSILNCRTYGILAGFSNPNKVVYQGDRPSDFGCSLSMTKKPQILDEVFVKIYNDFKKDTLISPTDEVGELLHELKKMSQDCLEEIYSSNRMVYLGLNRKRVIQIGEELNDIGGLRLMILVARQIPNYDQRQLEFAWSGIGQWMS